MISFNFLAVVVVVPSMLIGYGIQSFTGNLLPENGLAVLIAMGLALSADLGYRYRQYEAGTWRVISPAVGGQVMFMPLWCLALAMIAKVVVDQIH